MPPVFFFQRPAHHVWGVGHHLLLVFVACPPCCLLFCPWLSLCPQLLLLGLAVSQYGPILDVYFVSFEVTDIGSELRMVFRIIYIS